METYTVDATSPFDISAWNGEPVHLYHNERFWVYLAQTGSGSSDKWEMQATPFSGIMTGTFSGQFISVEKTQAQSTLTLQKVDITGSSGSSAFYTERATDLTLDIAGESSITASEGMALDNRNNCKLTINATQPLTLKAKNYVALNNAAGSTLNVTATALVRLEGQKSIGNDGMMTLDGEILAKGDFVNDAAATLALGTNPDVKILATNAPWFLGTLPAYLYISLNKKPDPGKEILLYANNPEKPAATFTTEGQYTEFIAFTTTPLPKKWKAMMDKKTLYNNTGATFFSKQPTQAFTDPQHFMLADYLPSPITLTHDGDGWKYDGDLFNGKVLQATSFPLILEAEGTGPATLAIDEGIDLNSTATALTIGSGDIRLSEGHLTIKNARTAIHVKSGATFTLTEEMTDKLFITSGNYVNEAGGTFIDKTGTVTQVVDGTGATILSYTPPATTALIPEKASEVSIPIVIPVGNAPVLTLQKQQADDTWKDVPQTIAAAQDVRSTTLSVTIPGEGTYRVGIRVGTTTLFTKPIKAIKGQSLDLSTQTEDITIGFDAPSGVWHYTAKAITRAIPTDAIAFDGTVTGKLPDNKTIAIDNTAQGTLTFEDAKIDAGSSGSALTVAAGATVTFVGTLTATTTDPSSPALLNNGAITIGNATISATNTADATKGISISDGATLLLASSGSELKTSGLENEGTVVVIDGASLTDTNGGALQKMYTVTITTTDNGNTLTVKAAGDIQIVTGDKVAENTKLTITAIAATDYSPEKITVTPESGTAVEVDNNGTYTMKTAAVTIAATFKYTPPVTPPTPPTPDYYTVTLPTVVGATTDPGAGDHEVESWDSFLFYLTLDPDYNQSVPVVTTDRGETLSPRSSDGAYTVKYVRTDVVLTIGGIVKNPAPVANAEIQSGTLIRGVGHAILITVDHPVKAEVLTFGGQTVRRLSLPAGETRIDQLSEGPYIVRLDDGTTQKVIVRR